jgi:hypothetical protein
MGLDMYVYRISKPRLDNKTYMREELQDAGMVVLSLDEKENSLYQSVIPYMTECTVGNQYYDMEKIRADYNLPDDAHITMWSGDCVGFTGRDKNGEYVRQEIAKSEIDAKYTLTKTENCLVFEEDEVSYWRKAYEKRSFFYDEYPVENCGYYKLDSDAIRRFNELHDESVPVEDATENSALFYHEWY